MERKYKYPSGLSTDGKDYICNSDHDQLLASFSWDTYNKAKMAGAKYLVLINGNETHFGRLEIKVLEDLLANRTLWFDFPASRPLACILTSKGFKNCNGKYVPGYGCHLDKGIQLIKNLYLNQVNLFD